MQTENRDNKSFIQVKKVHYMAVQIVMGCTVCQMLWSTSYMDKVQWTLYMDKVKNSPNIVHGFPFSTFSKTGYSVTSHCFQHRESAWPSWWSKGSTIVL